MKGDKGESNEKFKMEIEILNEKFVNQSQSDQLYFGVIKEQSLQLKNISKVLDNQIDLNEKQSKKINTLTKVIAQQSNILANQSKLIKQQALYIEKQSGK